MARNRIVIQVGRRYGFRHFLFDCFMIVITGGLWVVWMIIRNR